MPEIITRVLDVNHVDMAVRIHGHGIPSTGFIAVIRRRLRPLVGLPVVGDIPVRQVEETAAGDDNLFTAGDPARAG